jgi:V-type H+-transporting ATPase subunit E
VKQEQQAIDAQYDKKRKGAEVAQKISVSTLTNKYRLKLLHRREEHLQDLFSTSRASILTLANDHGRYVQFLEGVIVQGYLQLLEPSVTVHSRTRDVGLVQQASAAAARTYKAISGRDIEFGVEGTLSDEGCVSLLPSPVQKACC